MFKIVRKKSPWICQFIQIRSRSQRVLFWAGTRPPCEFSGNLFSSFRVIVLTNQPTIKQSNKRFYDYFSVEMRSVCRGCPLLHPASCRSEAVLCDKAMKKKPKLKKRQHISRLQRIKRVQE